ncbi:hypothetical protein AB6A40_010711 [Gnathostoma spinigerum]|uniref:Uncharacterized protein n=1 Tax=Gnathostoma spinigerum TaxID=75299 RepID=A0ABD6F2X8_9BILA
MRQQKLGWYVRSKRIRPETVEASICVVDGNPTRNRKEFGRSKEKVFRCRGLTVHAPHLFGDYAVEYCRWPRLVADEYSELSQCFAIRLLSCSVDLSSPPSSNRRPTRIKMLPIGNMTITVRKLPAHQESHF